MNQHQSNDRIKNLIKTISLIGIALMAVLIFLTIPVNYQIYAVLYAGQELRSYIQLTVALLILIAVALLFYQFMRENTKTE